MGKRGGNQKKSGGSLKKRDEYIEDQYDDEIDAFHKQRGFVPLDVNKDTDETDEDEEQPVFDLEGDDEDEDEDDDEDDDDIDDEDDENGGLTAKILRQKKYLRAKFGDVDDEMADDDKNKDEKEKTTWGGRKGPYHDGDNADFEILSSDDEALVLEEAEGIRLQKEALASYTAADMGLEDDDSEQESDRELTLEEMNLKGKQASISVKDRGAKDDVDTTFEEVKKDINALTKEEQMDVVYSSAPELVGLLSELNDAVEQLENKINPVMKKLKEGEIALDAGTRYLEVKQLLLLAYCQAITFYLLLKSEGQPVRDHPVIARLVEIKALLDKIKELDGNLPLEFEEILKKDIAAGTMEKVMRDNAPAASNFLENDHVASSCSGVPILGTQDAAPLIKNDALTGDKKEKREKRKRQTAQVDLQSEEMLRLRAALEEKLKNKGVLGSTISKPDRAQKRLKLANGKLETFDDYVDDADNKDTSRDLTSNMVSQLVAAKRKPKIVSGDDDLPKRDDIGERRRKFELKVLAGAGVKSEEDGGDEPGTDTSEDNAAADMIGNDDESESSGDDLYEQAKQRREAKLAAKAEMYARPTSTNQSSLPETVDGKRLISYQMEKNRGLTRKRNKDLKNPRKKYRKKHEQKVKRRKGQVREIRKPSGPYGGETTGINAGISRSVRF